ncbi:MAG TPA: hypothetical protein VLB32_04950 [Candidatus Acidoferrales bacterium]|nr:hypothetical protein [Candidatus Acidoferrales bacterium]
MRVMVFLSALILMQYACGQQSEPPPPPPPPPAAAPATPAVEPAQEAAEEKTPSAEQLQSTLNVKWEGGAEGKLVIELGIKNPGASPIRLGFTNSGRVCGVVLDSETAASQGPRGSKGGTGKGYRFPQMTAQVMGEETFAPGQTRTFRYEVPRRELGASLATSYTVDAWLCGHDKLRQRATAKTSDAK